MHKILKVKHFFFPEHSKGLFPGDIRQNDQVFHSNICKQYTKYIPIIINEYSSEIGTPVFPGQHWLAAIDSSVMRIIL